MSGKMCLWKRYRFRILLMECTRVPGSLRRYAISTIVTWVRNGLKTCPIKMSGSEWKKFLTKSCGAFMNDGVSVWLTSAALALEHKWSREALCHQSLEKQPKFS